MREGPAFYGERPAFLRELALTPAMQRLADVGMNCGCEYTRFKRFRRLRPYSRLEHSLGAARIVWHFTGDRIQSAATLFHDIAAPPSPIPWIFCGETRCGRRLRRAAPRS